MRKLIALAALLAVACPAFAEEHDFTASINAVRSLSGKITVDQEQDTEKARPRVPRVDSAALVIVGVATDVSDVEFFEDGTPFAVILMTSRFLGEEFGYESACIGPAMISACRGAYNRRTQLTATALGLLDPDGFLHTVLVTQRVVR